MNIRHIFVTIAAVLLTSAALADSSSVTSKKYVDDFMAGYQNKIPGSGADKLMTYDTSSEDGIGAKSIVSSLGTSTSAANVPNVGAVKGGLDGKQDTINGTAGYVMTGTGTAGDVGERAIYGTTTRYEDSLVTAESVNSGVINAVNNSLRRVNANGEPDNNGTLWEIADTVVALTFVPDGYVQRDYIYILNGGYLTTDIKPSYDGHYEIDFKTTTLGSEGATTYLGARPSGDGGLRLARITSQVFRVYGFGSYKDSIVTATGDTRYKFVWDNQRATLTTGSTIVFNDTFTGTEACPYPLAINGWNTAGSVTPGSEGIYVYSFKAWNAQGELIANYIPATQTNPSVVGFYDTVSGTFKVATSGTFEPGPAVAGN